MHSRNSQSSESLACWQMIPGTSYGMTGKKEKEHLELPGEAFNLAVFCKHKAVLLCWEPYSPFSSFSLPPFSSRTVESSCSPHMRAVSAELQDESTHRTAPRP